MNVSAKSYVATAILVATAACSSDDDAQVRVSWEHATSSAEGGGMAALIASAQAEGQLNVIALPADWCNYGALIDAFTDKYGIRVESVLPGAGSADELQMIRDNKSNVGPDAPDVIDIGPAYGPQARGEGLVTPYKVQTWDSIQGPSDPDGYYYVDYSGILALEVNTDIVEDVPTSYAALNDVQYVGQFALAGDPRTSSQAAQTVYAASVAAGGDMDEVMPGLEFFADLSDKGVLLSQVADSASIGDGATPITVQWSWNALANKDRFAGQPNTAVVFPSDVTWGGYYVQAVSAYAPHPAAARLWEEFLYSDEGQVLWVEGYCAPARLRDLESRNVLTPSQKAKLPSSTLLADAVVPSPDELDSARAKITAEWDNVVGVDVH